MVAKNTCDVGVVTRRGISVIEEGNTHGRTSFWMGEFYWNDRIEF